MWLCQSPDPRCRRSGGVRTPYRISQVGRADWPARFHRISPLEETPTWDEFRPSPPLNSRANHCGTASTGPAALRGSSPAGHLPLLQFEQVTAHDASPANYSSIRPTTQWFLPLLLRLGRIAFPFPYLHLRVHPTQPPSKWPHSCLKTTQNSYKAVACISCPAPLPASSPLPARPPIGSHLPSLGGHRRSARSIRRRCMDEWLMDSGG